MSEGKNTAPHPLVEQTARGALVAAGIRLLEEGLVARTWGNLSLRLSPTTFLITPSGVPWREVRPEDLSIVNIDDLEWSGARRPSSERGLHAAVYRRFPGTGAIVHTHQTAISPWIAARLPLEEADHPGVSLGGRVPVASYAPPGSQALAEAAVRAFGAEPASGAIFLANHGLVARGADLEEAFALARAIERRCAELTPPPSPGREIPGTPISVADRARLIEAIRTLRPGATVHVSTLPWTLALAGSCRRLVPALDDLAQLAGISFTIITLNRFRGTTVPGMALARSLGPARGLRRRDVLLVEGLGALCLGDDTEEAQTVAQVLEKGALATLGSDALGGVRPLPALDVAYMRWYYLRHYRDRGRRTVEVRGRADGGREAK